MTAKRLDIFEFIYNIRYRLFIVQHSNDNYFDVTGIKVDAED